MAHKEQINYVNRVKKQFPQFFKIENVNRSPRVVKLFLTIVGLLGNSLHFLTDIVLASFCKISLFRIGCFYLL